MKKIMLALLTITLLAVFLSPATAMQNIRSLDDSGATLVVSKTLVSANGFTGDITGSVTGDITGDVTGQTFGTATTYAADGAIALTDKFVILDGTSATAHMTLAAGTAGQVIYIFAVNVTSACDVDPAAFINGTTITFTPANEYAVLVSDGTSWYFVGGTAAIT